MEIYFIVLLVCLLSLFAYKNTEKGIYAVTPYIIMSVFCGLRGDVGIDTNTYNDIFYYISIGKDFKVELGYQMLTQIVQFLGGTQQLVFLVMSSMTSFFIYKYIKYDSEDFSVSTVVYMCIGPFYFSSWNTMREAFAVSIFLYSIRFIDKSFFKYMSSLIVASFFHYSAIFYILFWCFHKLIRPNLYIVSLVLLMSIGIFLHTFNIIPFILENIVPQYINYIDGHIAEMNMGYVIFFFICIFLIFATKITSIRIKSVYSEMIILSCVLVGVPLYTNQFVTMYIRLAEYVTPVLIIVLPNLRKYFKPSWYYDVILVSSSVIYYIRLTTLELGYYNYNLQLF